MADPTTDNSSEGSDCSPVEKDSLAGLVMWTWAKHLKNQDKAGAEGIKTS